MTTKDPQIYSCSVRYLREIECTFWDNITIINSKCQQKKDLPNNSDLKKEIYADALSILTSQKERNNYFRFLSYNFIFSQPRNIEQLKNNFHSYVFPNYIFLLHNDKCNSSSYLKLDFIESKISIFKEGTLNTTIDIDTIKSITKDKYSLNLLQYDQSNVFISPAIISQIDFIYLLLMFMARIKEQIDEKDNIVHLTYDNTKEERDSIMYSFAETTNSIMIQELKLLQDDYYLPSGIVYMADIYMDKPKKETDSIKCFGILGNSFIGIFEDHSLVNLLHIIPLYPSFVLVYFNHEKMQMRIKLPSNELLIYFDQDENLQMWEMTMHDIGDGKIEEKMDDEFLVTLSLPYIKKVDNDVSKTDISIRIEQEIQMVESQLQSLLARKMEISKYIEPQVKEEKKEEIPPIEKDKDKDKVKDKEEDKS